MQGFPIIRAISVTELSNVTLKQPPNLHLVVNDLDFLTIFEISDLNYVGSHISLASKCFWEIIKTNEHRDQL